MWLTAIVSPEPFFSRSAFDVANGYCSQFEPVSEGAFAVLASRNDPPNTYYILIIFRNTSMSTIF